MLVWLKTFHTLIWMVMTAANFLAFILAWQGKFNAWFWWAVGLLLLETLIIATNQWRCPITNIAERYTSDRRPNFDIYLPEWLARYNVRIFTVLILLETLAVLIRRSVV